MIGLDTNILVRYLAQDDPVQTPKATYLLERELTRQNPGFISAVVMVETAWVLERSYDLADLQIAKAIEQLLESDALVIEADRAVFSAMRALKDGIGSFADALIGLLCAGAGCSCTLTFDRDALRLPGFKLF